MRKGVRRDAVRLFIFAHFLKCKTNVFLYKVIAVPK